MKRFRFFISGMMMVLFMQGSLASLKAQKGTIQFLETYTSAEITSRLKGDDQLFLLLNIDQNEEQSPIVGYCPPDRKDEADKYLRSDKLLDQLPGDLRFCWGIGQEEHGIPLYALRSGEEAYAGTLYSDITQAEVMSDDPAGRHSLLLSFSEEGAEKWAKLTGKNIGKSIAIVIDDAVWSAPRVQEEIRMGKCMITGDFTLEEVQSLQIRLDPPL